MTNCQASYMQKFNNWENRMNLDDLTLGQIKQLQGLFGGVNDSYVHPDIGDGSGSDK